MVSFEEIFGLAYQLKRIEDLIFKLQIHFNGVLLVALFFDPKGRNPRKVFYDETKTIVDNLNNEISQFNKILRCLKHLRAHELEKVDIKKIKKIVFEPGSNLPEKRKYVHLKLNTTLTPLRNSIKNFFLSFENIYIPFGGKGKKYLLRKKIRENILKALDVYSIGHAEIAVFIVGKTLEMSVKDYLKTLCKMRKISYKIKEIDNWDFDTCINILKKHKFLTPTQYSKIMSVKWDRNIFAHPSKIRDIKIALEDCDAITKIGVNSIHYIEKQIIKFQKKN